MKYTLRRPPMEKTCPYCNCKFIVPAFQASGRRFCSNKCSGAARSHRLLDDPEQFYAYVWRLHGEVIYVGQGHGCRGYPSASNIGGRSEELAELMKSKWEEVSVEVFAAANQREAWEFEVYLTLELSPKYNSCVGFAGFARREHTKETKELIRRSSTGRPASELCKQKSRERMIERNRSRGKKCT